MFTSDNKLSLKNERPIKYPDEIVKWLSYSSLLPKGFSEIPAETSVISDDDEDTPVTFTYKWSLYPVYLSNVLHGQSFTR